MVNEIYKTLDLLTVANGELVVKLEAANKEIAILKGEIKRLENGHIELSDRLKEALDENARLCMVTNHRVESLKAMKRNKM